MKKLLLISAVSLAVLFSLPVQSEETLAKDAAAAKNARSKLEVVKERAEQMGGATEKMQQHEEHLRDAVKNAQAKHEALQEQRQENK